MLRWIRRYGKYHIFRNSEGKLDVEMLPYNYWYATPIGALHGALKKLDFTMLLLV